MQICPGSSGWTGSGKPSTKAQGLRATIRFCVDSISPVRRGAYVKLKCGFHAFFTDTLALVKIRWHLLRFFFLADRTKVLMTSCGMICRPASEGTFWTETETKSRGGGDYMVAISLALLDKTAPDSGPGPGAFADGRARRTRRKKPTRSRVKALRDGRKKLSRPSPRASRAARAQRAAMTKRCRLTERGRVTVEMQRTDAGSAGIRYQHLQVRGVLSRAWANGARRI